jgi:tight adherence protein B
MRRLAAAAAERDRVADEARAATTQARFTGLLVVALPAGAALFAELLEPGFISRVLAEPTSAALLVAAAGLQAAGFAVIRRLGRTPE